MTLKVRICPCSVQFSLFDELCFTSWTAKLRLQVPIPKGASVRTTFRKGPACSSKTWANAISFSCYQFSSWSHFLNVFVQLFFFCTYLWSARRFSSNHHASSEETSDTSGRGCIICSLSSGRFLNKMDSESKQQLPLSYYNWMLILIPFYSYLFVPPCRFHLLSSLTASHMTSWICMIPLN